nr:MAG TPA: hypothetical protein [Caudoviricetes sp.]
MTAIKKRVAVTLPSISYTTVVASRATRRYLDHLPSHNFY